MTASGRTDPGAATTTGASSDHPLVDDGSGQTPAEDVRSLAAKRALEAVQRHVKRREAIRRVLEDIDNELTEAVARAREAGVSDSAIAATAVTARSSNRRED